MSIPAVASSLGGGGSSLVTIDPGTVSGMVFALQTDAAHNDGSNLCDSIADRVAAIAFTQATAANRLLINTAQIPGHVVLDSPSGSARNLSRLADALVAPAFNGEVFTLGIFFRSTAPSAIKIAFENTTTVANGLNRLGQSDTFHYVETDGNSGTLGDANATFAHGQPGWHTFSVSRAASTTVELLLDGVLMGTSTLPAKSPALNNVYLPNRIAHTAGVSQYYGGWWGANVALPAVTQLGIHNWYRNAFGV